LSLLELLMGVAIVGILASIAIPSYNNYVEGARTQQAVADIRQIEMIIARFQTANINLPSNIAQLGLGDLGKDPWGNDYVFVLVSPGDSSGDLPPPFGELPPDSSFPGGDHLPPVNHLPPPSPPSPPSNRTSNFGSVNSDYHLYSRGPDGQSANSVKAQPSLDDIIRANDGSYVGTAADY